MNERDPNSRGQQYGGSSRHMPKQAGQWQNESPRQTGELQQDRDQPAGYDDYTREREARSSGTSSYPRTSAPYQVDDPELDEPESYPGTSAYQSSPEVSPRPYAGGHAQHYYDGSYGNRFASFTSEDYGGRDFYAGRGGIAGGMRSSDTYRPSYGVTRWFGDDYPGRRSQDRDYGEWRAYGERRGFLERAGDEIASWFGDEDAARRRRMDHTGRGPSDYTRSDERIREDVNDHLTHDPAIDATNISVSVSDCEVTLNGTVHDRWAKRRAEDVVERVSGVKHVQNNLRMADRNLAAGSATTSGWSSETGTAGAGTPSLTEKPH